MPADPGSRPNPLERTVDDSTPPPLRSSQVKPWLCVVYGSPLSRHIELKPTPVTIGRSEQADVVLDDDRVSKIHCAVRVTEDGGIEVTDQDSRNGTYVNGRRVPERIVLALNSEIRLGSTVLRVELKDPELVRLEEETFRAAITDPLTKVPNRRFFEERAAIEMARAQRHALPLALAFLDADHFKAINDTHGHAAGDAVLRELAGRLQGACRAEDLVCRYGGEEFVCLLCHAGLEDALGFAERLRARVAASPVESGDVRIPVTVSIGVSARREGDTLEGLLRRADAALYQAKQNGRNRVEREASGKP